MFTSVSFPFGHTRPQDALREAKGSLMRDLFFAKCPDLVNNSMGFSFSGFGGNGKGWSDASISSPKWHYTSR